jgi:LacI family transcriptional regulator
LGVQTRSGSKTQNQNFLFDNSRQICNYEYPLLLMKNYTIKEIARMAGVSAGTVDRVLHNRGSVSADKEAKVKRILEKIDFTPNPIAQSLKMNQRHNLVVLMPDDQLDEYWKPCFVGIDDLKVDLARKGITLQVLKYSPIEPGHFEEMCEIAGSMNPDGVMIGTLFLKESKKFLLNLEAKGIPYSLINNDIDNMHYTTFVGQNLIQSGRTAAHLFDTMTPKIKKLIVMHLEEEYENAYHMQQKELGFRQYFENKPGSVSIQTFNIKTDKYRTLSHSILQDKDSEIDGVFVTTSKAYLLVESGLSCPIIGYDLLSKNVQFLKQQKIKFLIYQNPKLQAFQGLLLLADHILKIRSIPRIKLLPIEIVSSENIHSYGIH